MITNVSFRSAAKHLLRYSRSHNGRALVVIKDGKIIVENYHNGGTKQEPYPLWSGSKSFCGPVAKQLVADSLIPSLDVLVSSVIPSWSSAGPPKSTTTLRRLMSLTSGLDAVPDTVDPPSYAECVASPMPSDDVGKIKYGNEPFGTFGTFVNTLVQPTYANLVPYIRDKILDPIGVTFPLWARIGGVTNEPALAGELGGCFMHIVHWAMYGEFMRTNNLFYSDITGPGPDYWAYGFCWWRCTDEFNISSKGNAVRDIPAGGYGAIGGDNNAQLYVLPQLGLVVARTGILDPTFIESEFVDLIMDL